jgi:RHS repeat-associated protein
LLAGFINRLVKDQLGSIRLVVNAENGKIISRIERDEFGQVLKDSKPDLIPFGFAGGLYDSDTKLVRFGARDYDPEVGRWTSKDPILFAGGDTNLYGYTFNDPINFIDPSGLKFEFRDAASQRIFNSLLNSSALSAGNRAMIEKLELSSSIIKIGQGTAANRPYSAMGLTEGYNGNTNSDITLWFSGTSNVELSALLHELTHADQILRDEPVTEGPAYQVGGDFLKRCK